MARVSLMPPSCTAPPPAPASRRKTLGRPAGGDARAAYSAPACAGSGTPGGVTPVTWTTGSSPGSGRAIAPAPALGREHHAPPVLVPFPVARAVGDRRFDQGVRVGVLPAPRGELAVEDLDRPPSGHTLTIGANRLNSTLAGPGRFPGFFEVIPAEYLPGHGGAPSSAA